MKRIFIKDYKRILATVLAITLICGSMTACGSKADTMVATILEFDTTEDLAAIDRETLQNSSNTLYKVGENYYAFFPSTGKMELVTKVQAYDETNIEVIDSLYNSTLSSNGEESDVTETYVTSVTTLDNVLNTRTSYLEHELDNCNANMLIEGTDSVTLTEYKRQLEEELAQLTQYKQSIVNTTELVVQSLKTQDVQDALMEQVSTMLDGQLNTIAKQNAYNQTVGLATEDSVKTLEKVVSVQQSLIETLQQKYENVDEILANKRITLAETADIVDTKAFKDVIKQLDTYATTYVTECEKLYNNISTKADAIEDLYSTLQNANNVEYGDVLKTLQVKYADMLKTQEELQAQITVLKTTVNSVEDTLEDTNNTNDVYTQVQTQLNRHEAELAALEDVLAGTNLATIDSLTDVQATLQERIKELEGLQDSLKDTMTQQQIDALSALKTDIENSISNETNSTASDLRSYIDTLSNNYNDLDSETQKSIDALRKLLNDNTTEQNAVNTAVNNLINNLDTNLTAQQEKLEEQKTQLVNLIDATAGQVQSDLMSALETSENEQETKLLEQKETLTELINGKVTELSETLKSEFNAELTGNSETINTAVTAVKTALDALTEDYATYKDTTDTTLSSLEALIATVKTATDTNTADLTSMQTIITRLTDETVVSLSTVQEQLTGELATLKTLVDDNYAVLNAEVTQLTETVNALNSSSAEISTKVTTLEDNVSSTRTLITELQNTLTEVQTALSGKAEASDVLTTLPIANSTDVGCVKVDDDTLKIMDDGTLYINTASLSTQIPNETIKVGTVWQNYEDIPVAYREYCLQANYVYLDSEPEEVYYKEVDTVWYACAYGTLGESSSSTCSTPDSTGYYTQTTTTTRTTDYVWKLLEVRPKNAYKAIEQIPVQVCYYGFDDGTGNIVWQQYAVKFDTTTYSKTRKVYSTITTQGYKVTNGVVDVSVDTRVGAATTTHENTTRTYLNEWLGDYATYGPDSGYKPSSFVGAYTAGCELTATQRKKMWDAGVLTDFAPLCYDRNLAANNNDSSNSYIDKYTVAYHNFLAGIAAVKNSTDYITNTVTLTATPKTLTTGANTTISTSAIKTPECVANFTDAGLAYKLAYLYGNHVWIYVGTST